MVQAQKTAGEQAGDQCQSCGLTFSQDTTGHLSAQLTGSRSTTAQRHSQARGPCLETLLLSTWRILFPKSLRLPHLEKREHQPPHKESELSTRAPTPLHLIPQTTGTPLGREKTLPDLLPCALLQKLKGKTRSWQETPDQRQREGPHLTSSQGPPRVGGKAWGAAASAHSLRCGTRGRGEAPQSTREGGRRAVPVLPAALWKSRSAGGAERQRSPRQPPGKGCLRAAGAGAAGPRGCRVCARPAVAGCAVSALGRGWGRTLLLLLFSRPGGSGAGTLPRFGVAFLQPPVFLVLERMGGGCRFRRRRESCFSSLGWGSTVRPGKAKAEVGARPVEKGAVISGARAQAEGLPVFGEGARSGASRCGSPWASWECGAGDLDTCLGVKVDIPEERRTRVAHMESRTEEQSVLERFKYEFQCCSQRNFFERVVTPADCGTRL